MGLIVVKNRRENQTNGVKGKGFNRSTKINLKFKQIFVLTKEIKTCEGKQMGKKKKVGEKKWELRRKKNS